MTLRFATDGNTLTTTTNDLSTGVGCFFVSKEQISLQRRSSARMPRARPRARPKPRPRASPSRRKRQPTQMIQNSNTRNTNSKHLYHQYTTFEKSLPREEEQRGLQCWSRCRHQEHQNAMNRIRFHGAQTFQTINILHILCVDCFAPLHAKIIWRRPRKRCKSNGVLAQTRVACGVGPPMVHVVALLASACGSLRLLVPWW